jgi:hypothetical protein
MMRKLTAVGAFVGVLLTVSLGYAQPRDRFGEKGQFIISADRLFSLFAYTHVGQDNFGSTAGNKITDTVNGTSISLLWGSSAVTLPGGGLFISPFTVPRVGFDYVLLPNFTVGGNLVLFFSLGGSTSQDATGGGATTSQSNDNPGVFIFGLEPRAGYILELNNMFSLWLRGGVSYYVETTKTTRGTGANQVTDTGSINQFALDLEPQFVFTPIPHVGFSAGPTMDIPLTGGHSNDHNAGGTSTNTSAWSSVLYFGVTVGMFTHF